MEVLASLSSPRGALPNKFIVPVHLTHPVKRNLPALSRLTHHFEKTTPVIREHDLVKGHQVNRVLPAVEIPNLEPSPSKLPVVADRASNSWMGCMMAGRTPRPVGRLFLSLPGGQGRIGVAWMVKRTMPQPKKLRRQATHAGPTADG